MDLETRGPNGLVAVLVSWLLGGTVLEQW
jgi:hypothetical protein